MAEPPSRMVLMAPSPTKRRSFGRLTVASIGYVPAQMWIVSPPQAPTTAAAIVG